ncbi:MAG: hypothetical protein ACMG6E_02170 [Candidatus Roizmanbacteria bacterium]
MTETTKDLVNARNLREFEISSSLKNCRITKPFPNAATFKEELAQDKQNHDGSLMVKLFCLFDTVLTTPIDPHCNDLRTIFKKLTKQIVAGDSKSLLTTPLPFELSNPTNSDDNDLDHEYFVALACTNRLRKIIPNFTYVLGSFKCHMSTNIKTHVIYEKIEGQDLQSQLATCSFRQFFGWMMQIIIAIQTAYDENEFTHYDLHPGNIKIANSAGKQFEWVLYRLDRRQTVWLRIEQKAMIHNFTRAHILVNDEHFGPIGLEEYGLYHDRGRPWYDLYKLLGFSLDAMLDGNNMTCFVEAVKMFQLIDDPNMTQTEAELIARINSERETYYLLSQTILPAEKDRNLWGYLEGLKELFPREWQFTCTTTQPRLESTSLSALVFEGSPIDLQSALGMVSDSNLANTGAGQVALAWLPDLADQLRSELGQELTFLNAEITKLSNRRGPGYSQSMSTDNFSEFVEQHVEPHLELKERIGNYMTRLALLRSYQKFNGYNNDLVEFELTTNFDIWKRKFRDVYHKLDQTYFNKTNLQMRDTLLKLMKY